MSEDKEKLSEAEKSHLKQKPAPTVLEWGARIFSLLMVVLLLGYFAWVASQPIQKPEFSFEVMQDKIAQRGNQWVVPVKLTNLGDMSTHNLEIEASLRSASNVKKAMMIPLLGPREKITTTFWFDQQPQVEQLSFSVNTYILP